MRITPHFTTAELGNPPSSLLGNATLLCDALELIRRELGAPLYVASGYRSAAHNRSVGGSGTSDHRWCLAADVRAHGLTSRELLAVAQRALGRDYDQLIWYEKSPHLHVGMGARERGMTLQGD